VSNTEYDVEVMGATGIDTVVVEVIVVRYWPDTPAVRARVGTSTTCKCIFASISSNFRFDDLNRMRCQTWVKMRTKMWQLEKKPDLSA
jgi:hypothetical protein